MSPPRTESHTLPHAPPAYSQRSRDIEPFHVMALLARANELEHAGHDVIHLEIGEPDFTTAAPIVAAGHTRYTAARGLPALREALATFYRQRYDVDLDPARIMITPGGSGALLLASALLVDPGKRWLLADPGYPCNRHFLRLVEGAAQLVPVGADSRYQLTPALLDAHWNADSVGALVASPANPTGTLLDRTELAALAQALQARGGHLVVDEIYHGLSYGIDAPSVLEVDDSAYVLNSFSKYFGMTGWRLGWLVAPRAAVPSLEKLAQNLYISASSIAQHAALACFLPETLQILEARRAEFGQRRDYLLPALRALGLRIDVEPQGAFYLYADVSAFTDDAQAFCAHFLETEHVAFTPGVDFGQYRAHQHVRIAYTQSLPRLKEAVARIARGLARWDRHAEP
ncbi:pyridoxal phosphate-dependent aminotransferase [Xanthomonas graminis]|jgi:aspartate/methionine/tyrosine aminotransferase|uniref:pyridoxal phosphate-dependent aminotransferase n=1 Tax=Xanthomonas graminis TaxID=3390026 RepID=UPI00029C9EB6|nr:pyridoxal phosphate-dependent aminotransferase [Xanthomonas translucens]EKU26580.1 aspartate transaminase [Xanthomonas translucens pv. graminis ART-Xtg29]OAX63023.1 aminotransferase [Xanthomonas translucens pv. graminis]UKE54015.1 pyridoxal phosphate-dependent aminotransferase [Xanthomonas translucens pv. graminis]WIH08350.1 pyridoxal phosphate-dependent aminotransferase [Xanthomonas translucens pv. graminis]WIH11691.1 pyridoxal phosphate-dependent aminotransferase [Xanthomonas translucens 